MQRSIEIEGDATALCFFLFCTLAREKKPGSISMIWGASYIRQKL